MEIRVRGVKKARAKGRVYYYHRATGKRIEEEFGTAAFLARVEELNGVPPLEPREGTLGALIRAYKVSPEFTQLAERTRKDYQRAFDYLKPLDQAPIIEFDGEKVIQWRDKAFREHKRRFANYVVQVLRLLFAWGKPRNWLRGLPGNPAEDVPSLRRPRDARKVNRAWSAAEVGVVLSTASGGLRAAIALGAYAGMSEGDALRFTWSGVVGGQLVYQRRKTGIVVRMPVDPRLAAILADTPKRSPIVVIGQRGRPFTPDGFRTMFFRLVAELETAGKVDPGLTFHGLRHTLGKKIIDKRGDTRDVQSMLGHASEQSARHYSDEADRARRTSATVRRLSRGDGNSGKR